MRLKQKLYMTAGSKRTSPQEHTDTQLTRSTQVSDMVVHWLSIILRLQVVWKNPRSGYEVLGGGLGTSALIPLLHIFL